MKTINWGIIGAGNISSTFATALKDMEHTKLVGVASRDLKRSEEFAKTYGAEKAYGSYDELVKDPDIDVIYIGTLHTEHKINAELCIKNKKSVLCEKPFTLNAKDAKYLMELAKENKVFLMEAMWTKFLPVSKKVKEWIADGKIGKVKKMQISFGFYNEHDETHRLFNYTLAGGALLDVGIYPITYAIYLMGTLPKKVYSTASMCENGIDEQNCMLFQFCNGAIAMLSSAVSVEVGKDAIIIGEKGRIKVPNFWMADKAFVYDHGGKLLDTFEEEGRINGYEYEAYEVNQCLRDGILESKQLPLKDTIDILTVMDGMREEWGLKYQQE